MGGTFAEAASGLNASINVLVLNQAGSEYVIEQMKVTPEQYASVTSDPDLAGRALDPEKLKSLDLDVEIDSNQLYFAFDDVADLMIGRFNDAVRDVYTLNHHLNAEYTGDDRQTLFASTVELTDTNGIVALATEAERLLTETAAEVSGSSVEDSTEFKAVPGAIHNLNEATVFAVEVNKMWFGHDKVPAPGFEYIDPNYDQFRTNTADTPGVTPDLELK